MQSDIASLQSEARDAKKHDDEAIETLSGRVDQLETHFPPPAIATSSPSNGWLLWESTIRIDSDSNAAPAGEDAAPKSVGSFESRDLCLASAQATAQSKGSTDTSASYVHVDKDGSYRTTYLCLPKGMDPS